MTSLMTTARPPATAAPPGRTWFALGLDRLWRYWIAAVLTAVAVTAAAAVAMALAMPRGPITEG